MANVTREEIHDALMGRPIDLIARMSGDPDVHVALRLLDLVNDLLRGVVERQEKRR